MGTLTDQTLAQRTLEMRERGYTFGLFYRRMAKRYLFLFAFVAGSLAFIALLQVWPIFWLALGLYGGSLARDIGWVLNIRRTWPFSEKVTDWEKVQRLADG